MSLIDTYTQTDITGQVQSLDLRKDSQGWVVALWAGPDEDNLECYWEVRGKITSYVDGNPNRPIRTPFTEDEARAEFERWRILGQSK